MSARTADDAPDRKKCKDAVRSRPPRPVAPPPRPEDMPAELKARPQWVAWRYAWREGKWTKLPLQARQFQDRPNSRAASTTDPKTWAGFDQALAFYLAHRTGRGAVDGIGYVFAPDDPFAGVDLDGCLGPDGEVLPWAAPYIARFPSYGEVSPSGRGVKFTVRGRLDGTGTRRGGFGPDGSGAIEVYDRSRFFTMTGDIFDASHPAVVGCDAALQRLYREIKPRAAPGGKARGKADGNGTAFDPLTASDEELVERARKARNGTKFSALYDRGDTLGYVSGSEADLALAGLIAFWTGDDASRIERIFGHSARARRGKWGRRPDYRQRTIARSLEGRTEFYSPPKPADRNGSGNGHPAPNGAHHAEDNGHRNGDAEGAGFRLEALSDEDLGIVAAETLEPESIEWLWPDRVAVGKLNLLAGEGGDGKSQQGIAIAAAITTGGMLPDGSGAAALGQVLILAAEDGACDTIVPRLMAAGADLARVKVLTAKFSTPAKDGTRIIHFASFQDLDYWRVVFGRCPSARLMIADPIPAFLGRGVNDHRNAEVRSVLEPFVDLLSERRVALMGITHLGKSADVKSPVHKILGSVAYGNLARTVHITARDPDDRERRLLFQVKNNVAPLRPTLAYRIEEAYVSYKDKSIRSSRVVFDEGTVDLDAAETLAAGRNPGKRPGPPPEKTRKLAEWLFDYLTGRGCPTPLGKIFDDAGGAGWLGNKKPDGKWSSGAMLYLARDFIAQLAEPREGRRVDEFDAALGKGGRAIRHWQLVDAAAAF